MKIVHIQDPKEREREKYGGKACAAKKGGGQEEGGSAHQEHIRSQSKVIHHLCNSVDADRPSLISVTPHGDKCIQRVRVIAWLILLAKLLTNLSRTPFTIQTPREIRQRECTSNHPSMRETNNQPPQREGRWGQTIINS